MSILMVVVACGAIGNSDEPEFSEGEAIAVVKTLTAWQDGLDLDVRYLSDGVNGLSGTAVVADISLAGGLEAMNEFSCTFQGSGTVTTVP